MPFERLRKQWDALDSRAPLHPALTFVDDWLLLGAGTKLAFAKRGAANLSANDDARICALLCAAYGRPLKASALRHIHRALVKHSEGDSLFASMHLAMTGLWPLREPIEAAHRLFMADDLMKAGHPPRDLMRGLGFDPEPIDRLVRDYNPDQPRVPAGSGRPSGQWTRGGEGGEAAANDISATDSARSSSATPARAPVVIAPPISDAGSLLSADLAPAALRALARTAGPFSVAFILFDTIFVPSNAGSVFVEGAVPGYPNLRYRWNQDEGNVVIHSQVGDDWVTLAQAQLSPAGIYRDESGRAIGRVVDGALILDPDTFAAPATANAQAANDNHPRLCPAPMRERTTGWSDNSKGYQVYVTGLAPGLMVMLNGVSFDGCRESDGTMLDAKGHYEQFFAADGTIWASFLVEEWETQLQAQSNAAALAGRNVEWHIQELRVAMEISKLARPYTNIKIIYDPWP